MNFNIFKRNSRIAGAICITAAMALSISCKDDEYTSRGDLFQPRFATDPAVKVTNNNDISIVWYKVNDAVSYTVQFFEDNYYQRLFLELETENPFVNIQDIPYATRYYVRVRSNAREAVHNSQWARTDFTTDPRPAYAHILQGVSRTEIEDNSVVLHWTVDAANPVDSFSVVPAMDDTLPVVGGYLTAEQKATGEMKIENLVPSTLYTVNIYDTSKPRKYDKPYNTVTFRTTGPAPAVIEIGVLDDLSQILRDNNEDPDVPEGTEYSLPGGSAYTITPFAMRKGFRIVGPEDDTKPVITINGTWSMAAGAYISAFSFENVVIRNQALQQYFFNSGNPYTIESVSMVNVDFRGINRGFWRHQASNVKHIMELTLDNCWFDQCGWQTGTYGTFNFGSAGKNEIGDYDQIDAIIIRNTTFSRGGYKQDPGYGWGNLIAHNTSSSPIDLTVENVTFYDFCVNNRLIDITNTEGSTVTVRNVLVASPMSTLFSRGSGTKTTFDNNYFTTDYPLGGSDINASAVGVAASDLFVNPEAGDYTIKDKTSLIYITRAGDPRWLK